MFSHCILEVSRQGMKRFMFHTFPRHSIEYQMRNWQSIKYISDSFQILPSKARDFKYASQVQNLSAAFHLQFHLNLFNKNYFFTELHENRGESCSREKESWSIDKKQ